MLKLYYETDAMRVSYDEELQLGVGEWKGFLRSEELRKAGLDSLDFVNKHNITRWLADRRKMKAIRQQDQQWTIDEFVPKLMQSPVRRIANLVSEDLFNKMAIESMYQRSGGLGSIAFRDFDRLEDAMEWLKQPFEDSKPADSNLV
ncbi:hypothetical protein H8S95_16665 [Pontibacter sp. KCTC 32443]|uniref:hypothetical protein n=1 Tax=Pontibacter TaxID=323449 RepID=UPI00164DAA56|nr:MULTISPECIES: hypothetical protein [Pontibacter]MBC5775713.1 hypothetical protein [Pontibacter sp. KCTC 32443]